MVAVTLHTSQMLELKIFDQQQKSRQTLKQKKLINFDHNGRHPFICKGGWFFFFKSDCNKKVWGKVLNIWEVWPTPDACSPVHLLPSLPCQIRLQKGGEKNCAKIVLKAGWLWEMFFVYYVYCLLQLAHNNTWMISGWHRWYIYKMPFLLSSLFWGHQMTW